MEHSQIQQPQCEQGEDALFGFLFNLSKEQVYSDKHNTAAWIWKSRTKATLDNVIKIEIGSPAKRREGGEVWEN